LPSTATGLILGIRKYLISVKQTKCVKKNNAKERLVDSARPKND
jgi:hypothetical protein